MKTLFILLVVLYQKAISPWFISSCRYYPTCSEYTKQALKKYGVIKGSWFGIKRILRCHPFNTGGYDPLD